MQVPDYKYTFLFDDKPFFIGRFKSGVMVQERLEQLHHHIGLEIMGINQGDAQLFYNGKEYPVHAGDCIFLDAMLPHQTAGPNCETLVVHLDTNSIINAHVQMGDQVLLQPFIFSRTCIDPILRNRPDLLKMLADAHASFSSASRFGKIDAWSKVLTVLIGIAAAVHDTLQTTVTPAWSRENRLVEQIVEFLNVNYAQDIDLEGIARHFATTPSRVSHIFKKHMNTSPIDYRNRIRIDNAIALITNSDFKFSYIAGKCGFKSLPNFYVLFRKTTGVSPKSLRTGRSD